MSDIKPVIVPKLVDWERAAIGWRIALAGDEQDAANWAYEHVSDLLRACDELRAENERLTQQLRLRDCAGLQQEAEIERLRQTVSRYFDILERQQQEVMGEDASLVIAAMEESSTGARELADARDALYDALDRTKRA